MSLQSLSPYVVRLVPHKGDKEQLLPIGFGASSVYFCLSSLVPHSFKYSC